MLSRRIVRLLFGLCLAAALGGAAPVRAQSYLWTKVLSSNVTQQAIHVDNAGNSYLTGSFSGTATFGYFTWYLMYGGITFPIYFPVQLTSQGSSDLFVAKYTSAGALVWVRQAGDPVGSVNGFDIGVDADDNVYVAGQYTRKATFNPTYTLKHYLNNPGDTRRHLFVAKFNATGFALWVKSGTSSLGTDVAQGLAVDRFSGEVAVTGWFNGTLQFPKGTGYVVLSNSGSTSMFLLKYDTEGALQWGRKAGGTNIVHDMEGTAVAMDKYDGYLYVTGSFEGTANFGSGKTLTTNAYLSNVYLAKFEPDGTPLWVRQAGQDARIDEGADVDVDVSGNAYITGTAGGNITFGDIEVQVAPALFRSIFIAKYSASGTALWGKYVGESFDFSPPHIKVGPIGGVYLTGNFIDEATFDNNVLTPVASGSDVFIAKYYNTGEVFWVKQIGGNSDEYSRDIGIDNGDRIYLAGYSFTDGLTLGGTSIGSNRNFLTKLAQPAVPFISDFSLINAATDASLGTLYNFSTIDYAALGTSQINVRANANAATGSVLFELDFNPYRTENVAPYALAGDDSGDYHPFVPGPRSTYYRVVATPYSEDNGLGVRGTGKLLFFKITDSAALLRPSSGTAILADGLMAYPVPATDDVTLRFQGTQDERATLTVYDAQGREVTQLYAGAVQTDQTYEVRWDASAHPAGIYLARLVTPSRVLTQKLVVEK